LVTQGSDAYSKLKYSDNDDEKYPFVYQTLLNKMLYTIATIFDILDGKNAYHHCYCWSLTWNKHWIIGSAIQLVGVC